MKVTFIERYRKAVNDYFEYRGDQVGLIIKDHIAAEYELILTEVFGVDGDAIKKMYDEMYWQYYGISREDNEQ